MPNINKRPKKISDQSWNRIKQDMKKTAPTPSPYPIHSIGTSLVSTPAVHPTLYSHPSRGAPTLEPHLYDIGYPVPDPTYENPISIVTPSTPDNAPTSKPAVKHCPTCGQRVY